MVIVLEHNIRDDHKQHIRDFLEGRGFKVREIVGEEETIFGAVGSVGIDQREVEVLPGVLRVIPITKPYKLASREMKREDTVIKIGSIKVGSPRVTVMAGPCSVENRDNLFRTAEIVRKSGAVILRGGAFKPRTSPYSFQGLGEEGLRFLREAGDEMGMPVVSEIVSPSHVNLMSDYVDIFQIGARNMQNFELLKSVGAKSMAVLLKRGMSATIEEWLMSAEYLMAHGADNVMLCERGIRTFETYTRNSLDISSIPVVKKLSHLPVIVDPSHATGIRAKVPPVALAAVAAGADGLMIEVHPDPDHALSDGPQSLYPEQFERLMRDIEALSPVVEKEMARLPERQRVRLGVEKTGVKNRKPVAVGPDSEPLSGEVNARGGGGAELLQIAFQGERGAYSEMALQRYFHNDDVDPLPRSSFRDVFVAVLEGRAAYGIVPLENSLAGSVHESYDLFLHFPDIKIVGETQIRIVHSLIGLPDAEISDIAEVYSHPQGLAQCAGFLGEHPDWKRVPFYDTAGSVAHVAAERRRELAAIANSEAASVYGLRVLREGIETNPHNYTRFAILAREEDAEVEAPDKASIVFSTPDRAGALFRCMKTLSDRALNMKKIESRPIQGKPWTYMFYLDLEMPSDRGAFDGAMAALREESEGLQLLGTYKSF